MNELTRQNFGPLLKEFIAKDQLSTRKVAGAIGCSESTLIRILTVASLPADEMMRQGGTLMEIGFPRYSKLTDAEKERISEAIGTVGGGAVGFSLISAAVSTFGVSGLSAVGITSGLAAMGGVIGGGMVAGVAVAAAIPVAVAAAAYGAVKGVKYAVKEYTLSQEKIDPLWEILPDSKNDN